MSKISVFISERRNNEDVKPVIGYYGYWVQLTYLSVVSAIFGIHFALGGNIKRALICLMISGLCDGLDGRVASMKERNDREKKYGIQIDALADIISFGVFPAIIGYALSPLHLGQDHSFAGIAINSAITAAYFLAALIRLAYFNVIEEELQSKNKRRTYYEGLPVTSVSLIIPFIYSICILFDFSISLVYSMLLAFLSIAFVLKIKIPKPRGRAQLLLFLFGLPIISYLIMSGGI